MLLFATSSIGFLSLYLQHELLFFLCCLIISLLAALRLSLPNPNITFYLKSHCPAFFQAEGKSTHHLELSADFTGSSLPYLSISAQHDQSKGQIIKSSQNKISKFISGKLYHIYLLIEPKIQGGINFNGIKIKSLATLGLFEWQHFIELPIHRPVHPRQISLKHFQYLKMFWQLPNSCS